MNNKSTDQHSELQARFAEAFARLPEQDIEQFYAHYQLWVLRRRVPLIEKQIELLQEHLGENKDLIVSLRPSAIALAVLVRLQSSGVSNIDLLDQMLERGEDWLDHMMQRLDYCEQVEDFIQGDYTQWCIRSLEGAYDWIDTLLGSPEVEPPPLRASETAATDIDATEELLLQKLSLDDEGQLETTLKQPATRNERVDKGEVESTQPTSVQEEISPGVAERFLLAGEHTTEARESAVEDEAPAELADWEDLESAELRPDPWYSVNLAADTPFDAAQSVTMHDWINVLQADAHPVESSTPEAVESNEEALPTPTISEGTYQAESVTLEPAEISEEELAVQATPGESIETPVDAEVPGESEINLESEETPVDAEVPGEPERIFTPNEEEADEANTPLTSDVEATESTWQNEGEPEEYAIAATTGPLETANVDEEVAQPTNESATIPEEAEPTLSAEEALLLAKAEEEMSTASAVEGEEPESSIVETAQTQEPEPLAVEAELAESPAEEVREEQEVNSNLETASEASSNSMEETASSPEQGETDLTEEQKADLAQEAELISRSYSHEEAVIVRDILGEEGDELPWYEYLARGEQVVQASQRQSEIDQPIEFEGAQNVIPAESFERVVETPELQEDPRVDQSAAETVPVEPVVQAEHEKLEQEPGESQSWEMYPGMDETQPIALREIQQAQAAQLPAEPEASTNDPESAASEESVMEISTQEWPVLAFTPSKELEAPPQPIEEMEAPPPSLPAEPTVQSPPQSEEPPAKVGFWRRLFGRKGKK